MTNPWLDAFRLAQLCFDAQSVVALRMMRLASGDKQAAKEAERMVNEKFAALAEAQANLIRDMMTGKAHLAPARAVALYHRKVRANRKRLSGY